MIRSLFLLSLCSCAGALALRKPDPAKMQRLQLAEEGRKSMSAGGSLTLRYKGVPLKAALSVTAGIGGYVRLDVSSDAGQVLLAFAANPEDISLIDFERRQFAKFPAGKNDLAALSIAGLDARALSALLLTRIPCTNAPRGADDTHIVYDACLGGELTATYNGSYLRGISLKRGNAETFSADLQAHTTDGFARRITLTSPDNTVVVALEELETNVGMDPDLFSLSPPPGISLQNSP